jgi:hypothetical protein
MENLARYVACLRRKACRRGRQVRASFSQERMTYLPDESQVLYRSKDGKNEKTFDALEWLAATPACAVHADRCGHAQAGADRCSHVPSKGGQAPQGRTNDQVLWLLQQRLSGKAEEGGPGWIGALHHDVPSLPLTHKARIPYVPSQ